MALKRTTSDRRLAVLFAGALASLVFAERFLVSNTEHRMEPQMRAATALAAHWLALVEQASRARTGSAPGPEAAPYEGLIGLEHSEITTTLGSREAKRTALNPEFAALLVRLIADSGAGRETVVGVTLSGSFPSLAIATLAALQTLGMETVAYASLGASSYGANAPDLTWIDMEGTLRRDGGLLHCSDVFTLGGEGDAGGGMMEEGMAALRAAARRNGAELLVPASLSEAIERRVDAFTRRRVGLLINIGGNQAVLGGCAHGASIPNGLHRRIRSCRDASRGALVRMNERGVPFIHLLNIRSLAARHGLPLDPTGSRSEGAVYRRPKVNRLAVGGLVGALLGALFLSRVTHGNLDAS